MPRSFIKFLVPGHHGRSIHPEYFVFLVALSARIKTTKRINQMAMDGYGFYFGAKSNQSLAVDVDYGTCLIPYHSSSMERYFTEFRQRYFLLRFRINSLPLSSCSFVEWTVFDVFSVFTGLGKEFGGVSNARLIQAEINRAHGMTVIYSSNNFSFPSQQKRVGQCSLRGALVFSFLSLNIN